MKKGQLLIISYIIFFVCCSMSKCNIANNPGPVTIVQGKITDTATGKPIPGLQLKIESENSQDVQVVTTNADGTYYLKFTPQNIQSYIIMPGAPYANPYDFGDGIVYLGIDNIINLQLFKFVNLTIHLVNNSSYNKQQFQISINSNNNFSIGGFPLQPARIIDTTFKSAQPYLTYYTIESDFFNGSVSTDPTAEVFTKSIYLGKVDTTVNITNP